MAEAATTPALSVDDAANLARLNPDTAANSEPGFANTYGPGSSRAGSMLLPGLAALGTGGLGLLLLYQRHLQDKAEREKQKLLKSADIMSQLPGAHPKDMLLGAALGGGAGLLYDLAKGQPEGRRLSTTLKRLLIGAGTGAVGGNLIGDRARRYISNTQLPAGYGTSSLLPRSFQHFWDAAVADKPSFDPEALKKLPELGGSKEVADAAIAARYELVRRSMNLHRDNSNTDIWQRNKGVGGPDHFSLNERNPNYEKMLQRLFLPSKLHFASPLIKSPAAMRAVAEGSPDDKRWIRALGLFFKDPQREIQETNKAETAPTSDAKKQLMHWRNTDLFGANTLLGGQQIMAQPGKPGEPVSGTVLDRFDITPEKTDMDRLTAAIKNLDVLRPSWYKKPAESGSDYYNSPTNSSWLKSILSRVLWDKWLVEEHPWVSQKFQFTPDAAGGNALQFQNAQGQPVGTPMTPELLSGYLFNLQNQK